jgi:uncharacterized tellurite resistance protein B-like protein
MDESVSRNVCRLLAGLVVADDNLDPDEDAFIDKMLSAFDLPASARDGIFPIMDADEAAREIAAMHEQVQQATLTLLIEAAATDGRIAPEETEYLGKIVDAIGVSRSELAARLKAELKSVFHNDPPRIPRPRAT